jgi:hypothetical protein
MSEVTLKSINDQSNLNFHVGMVARMETAFHSYGDYRNNFNGKYKKAFLKDVEFHLRAIVDRWKADVPSTTNANCNAIISVIERLLFYVAGGKTRGGEVSAGNTEYLMDSSNFEMIEFSFPQVPKAKFRASGWKESPGSAGTPEGEVNVAALHTYGNKQGD